MKQYLDLLKKIQIEGNYSLDRTGTGTFSIFGEQLKFDLRKGFPLVTTKKVFWKGIVHELLWFISGSTNIKYLIDNGIHIWDDWAYKNEIGPLYGSTWRKWESIDWIKGERIYIDQLQIAIDTIKTNPHSRRIIVNTWDVGKLPNSNLSPRENVKQGKMALAPCHMMFQFYVSPYEQYLDLQMYQRSVDSFLGLPFNIASYSLLLMMVAQITNKIPRNFIWTGGDIHIYSNHMNQVSEQLSRKPFPLPEVEITAKDNINDFTFSDISLVNYKSHPAIKGEISV